VDAYRGIGAMVEGRDPLPLAYYYPETARGEIEPYQGETIYWSGPSWARYGVTGPTDGRMVPIEARYLEPMPLNIFDPDKLAALVGAIRDGERPVVRPGYIHAGVVTRSGIEESREYARDIEMQSYALPYDDDDLGALTGQVRDGNHRSFAGLVAGADVAWVLLSDNDVQSLMNERDHAYLNRVYRAIRRAQRERGAPQLTRPRRKPVKRTAELDAAEERYKYLRAEEQRLAALLYRRWEHHSPHPASGYDPMERPELFFRLLMKRLYEDWGGQRVYRQLWPDPDYERLRTLGKERLDLWRRLSDLREAAGLDGYTGERK
jgi:hypothetical protein